MHKNTTKILFALKNETMKQYKEAYNVSIHSIDLPFLSFLITITLFAIFTIDCQYNNYVDNVDLYRLGLPRALESQVSRTCSTNVSCNLMKCKSMSQLCVPRGC